MPPPLTYSEPKKESLEIFSSRNFPGWLKQEQVSLAFSERTFNRPTSRESSSWLGSGDDKLETITSRNFRCMGLWSDGQTIWASTAFQLWRFENCLQPGEVDDGFDRLFVPRIGYTTGDIDIHDIAVEDNGRVVFVATLFGCLATLSERHCFQPLWRPPFISRLAAEDRCHLNGVATLKGKARFVTAVSQADIVDGWREHRSSGGCIIDIDSNDIVVTQLSMPHSPRCYRDEIWLLDSGTGNFGRINLKDGAFEAITFCPGYARGLAFHGDFAIVGLSKPRENRTFSGLPLDENLARRKANAWCGLLVIDLKNGDVVHWLRLEGKVTELYDIAILPGVRRPKALGFKSDEIRYTVTFEGGSSMWKGATKR